MHQPYQTVEEFVDAASLDDFFASEQRVNLPKNFDLAVGTTCISNDDSGDIDSEVAVAAQHIGDGEGHENKADNQNLVQRLVVEIEFVVNPHVNPANDVAGQQTDSELQDKGEHNVCHAYVGTTIVSHNLNHHDGEHVRHRVVGAAFKLQKRPQIVAQRHLLRLQDAEHRRRIG